MIGWLIAQPLGTRKSRLIVTVSAILPDIDGIGAIFGTDYYARYHHTVGHNLFFGLSTSIILSLICEDKKKTLSFTLLAFHSHLLGDLFGSGEGWGIPYFWPYLKKIYELPFQFRWELDSWQNLVVTFLCVMLIIYCALKKNRTLVEIFSEQKDRMVVNIFKSWFKNEKN